MKENPSARLTQYNYLKLSSARSRLDLTCTTCSPCLPPSQWPTFPQVYINGVSTAGLWVVARTHNLSYILYDLYDS